ncbi:MAG: adenylyltransferase/cytidyltransferase family protein [Candidatus Woesebacteria bacterium]|jgi:rfaE bifunctional protein nucleotidyltransferase chain/domain
MKKNNGHKIILDLDKEKSKVSKLKKIGKKIVLTQGSFDMVHIGHARYFEAAKKQGDVLIVGVDDDEKIRHRKGPDRPVVPQEERLEMLTYLSSVDVIVLKKFNYPRWHLIRIIKPDVLVATRETYSDEELEQLKEYCGRVLVLAPMATTSTSAKIRRVQIGTARRIESTLKTKLIGAMEDVLKELKDNV